MITTATTVSFNELKPSFNKYFGVMMACTGRNQSPLFNPLKPNDLYMRRTAQLTPDAAFYIFI